MKRGGALALCTLLWPVLVGMGGLGGSAPVNVPEPSRNFSATIVDQGGISTRMERFSIDGRTAVSGELGSGIVSIDFGQIDSVQCILRESRLEAKVFLKEGDPATLFVDKSSFCYGKLPYGNFKIPLEAVHTIKIHGEQAAP